MKCILHIGTEKTGSTILQNWLYLNQKELSVQRIGLSKFLQNNNNRDLCAFFQSSYDDFFRAKGITDLNKKNSFFSGFLDNFSFEIKELGNDHDYMIITSEHFHSRLTDINDIKALRDFLFLHFEDVKVICYFREQSLVRESLYSTALRCGYSCSLAEFHQSIDIGSHYYNYFIMFSKWESVFGINKLEPVMYDRNCWYGGDIRKDFITRVFNGICLDDLNYSIDRANEKLSYVQALLVRMVNSIFNDTYHSSLIRNQLVSQIMKNNSLVLGDLIDNRKVDFYKQFDESNKLFFEKFFGKPENSFNEPLLSEETSHLFNFDIENTLISGFCDILRRMAFLFNDDADKLKNIALKYESQSLLTRDDVLTLMKLARRSRPDDSFIKLKIIEWEK
jgi:hypothetical protein